MIISSPLCHFLGLSLLFGYRDCCPGTNYSSSDPQHLSSLFLCEAFAGDSKSNNKYTVPIYWFICSPHTHTPIWSSAVLNKTRQDETSLTGSSHQFPDLLEWMYMKTSQKDDCERRFLPCHYYVKTAVRSWFVLALFFLSHPWGTVLRLACCSPSPNKWTSCGKKGNFRTFFWVWRGNLWQQHSAADACLLTAGFLLIVLLSHSLKVAGLCWTTRSRTWLKWKTQHLMWLHIGFCCSSSTSACTFVSFLIHQLTFWLDRVNMQTLNAGALYY